MGQRDPLADSSDQHLARTYLRLDGAHRVRERGGGQKGDHGTRQLGNLKELKEAVSGDRIRDGPRAADL